MGIVVEDVVQLAGFAVLNQQFGMSFTLIEVVTTSQPLSRLCNLDVI